MLGQIAICPILAGLVRPLPSRIFPYGPIKEKIWRFLGIKKGDVFIIMNVPNEGVVVYKNGTKKGSIDGHDFKKALFGIWLCDKPADKDLKDEMLGK